MTKTSVLPKVPRKSKNPDAIMVAPVFQGKSDLSLEDLGRRTLAAPSVPHLNYFGGPLLANVQIYTIFWGKNWATSPALQTTMDKINGFFKAILVSPLMDQLQEYSVAGRKIGHGNLIGSKIIAQNAPTTHTADSSIRRALKSWLKTPQVPPPNPNTLYFIYTEPNVVVSMGGSKSCSSFCGYHDTFSNLGSQVFYAVMPYPSCSGCLGGMSELDALCATTSHELAEAITDPIPGMGWYDQVNGEIGDICAWKFKKVDGFDVQLEWSNQQNKCV